MHEDSKLLECTCWAWQESIPQIISAQLFVSNHGVKYTGSDFKYCPFCGAILLTKEEQRPKEIFGNN